MERIKDEIRYHENSIKRIEKRIAEYKEEIKSIVDHNDGVYLVGLLRSMAQRLENCVNERKLQEHTVDVLNYILRELKEEQA